MNAKAFLFAAFTVIIWGSAFPAIRASLLGGYSPGHLVLIRYLIASALFLLYALWPGVKLRLPKKEDLLRITILAWIGISVYHIGISFGQQTVSAGTTGMLIGSAPVFSAIIAAIVLKEKLGLFGWIGLGMGFTGITIITLGTTGSSMQISHGALFILMSAIATSIFFVYQKPLFSRYNPIELTAYFTWIGTIPFLFFSPGLFQGIQHATLEAHLSTVYVGVFPAAIGYATWAIALSLGKASTVTSMLYIEPAIVILISWLWLNEWPSTITIVGGVIAISGVLVVNLLGKKLRRTESENAA